VDAALKLVNDLLRTAPILQAASQQKGLTADKDGKSKTKVRHGPFSLLPCRRSELSLAYLARVRSCAHMRLYGACGGGW
jgi:hypothetical protein